MIYSYNEAAYEVLDGAVTIGIQGKNGSIHQGHIDLINYGKTLGRVVVIVFSYFNYSMNRLLIGIPSQNLVVYSPPSGENLNEEIASIEALGVDVVIKSPLILEEEMRLSLLQEADMFVQPYKSELLVDRKIDILKYQRMEYIYRKSLSDLSKKSPIYVPQNILLAPDVGYFFVKAAYKNYQLVGKSYTNLFKLYPSVTKNAYGMRLGSNMDGLNIADKAILAELKVDVSSKVKKGKNDDLIKETNDKKKDKSWKVEHLIRYEDGIFGKSKLDYYNFRNATLNIGVDDIDFLENK